MLQWWLKRFGESFEGVKQLILTELFSFPTAKPPPAASCREQECWILCSEVQLPDCFIKIEMLCRVNHCHTRLRIVFALSKKSLSLYQLMSSFAETMRWPSFGLNVGVLIISFAIFVELLKSLFFFGNTMCTYISGYQQRERC